MLFREYSQAEWWMDPKFHRPFVPIVLSILGLVAWLLFILVYALWWSNSFSLFQNIIVTIVSLLVTGLLLGLIWVVWGFKFAKDTE